MDIYGNPIEGDSLANGGTISGDLVVTGDGTFENITVTDTATIHTIINEQELKIDDPLIEFGVGNNADAVNLGIIEHYNDGAEKYSGLIRDRTTKKQYLYEGATPAPTTTTDIAALPRGNLVCGDLETSEIDVMGRLTQSNTITATSGQHVGASIELSAAPTADTTAGYLACDIDAVQAPGPEEMKGDLTAMKVSATSTSSVRNDTTRAAIFEAQINDGTGRRMYAASVKTSNFGTGPVDKSSGLIVFGSTAASTITEHIGIDIRDQTDPNVTTAYSIKSLGTAPMVHEGSISVGPAEEIKLESTGEIECKDVLVKSFNPTIQFEGALPTSQSLINMGTPANTQNAFIQCYSNTASAIDLASEKRAFLRWGNQNDPIDEFCIERDFDVGVGDTEFIYRPFGGATKRIPLVLPLDGDSVRVNKLDVNGAFTLPDVDGTPGQVLQTDGAGDVTWETASSGTPANILVQQAAAQSIPNLTETTIAFATEIFKDGVDHDNAVNNSRLTATQAGKYCVSYDVWFDVSATGGRTAFISVNGAVGGGDVRYGRSQVAVDDIGGGANPISLNGTALINLGIGDYVEVHVIQNSGGALDIGNPNLSTRAEFSAFIIGDVSGGSGGGSLQDAYLLSATPEITTDAGQGLTIRSGGVTGLEQVFKIQDDLGATNARIDASGLGVFADLQATGDTNLRAGLSIGSIPSGFEYEMPVDNQTAQDGDTLRYDLASKSLQFSRQIDFSQTLTTTVDGLTAGEQEISSSTGLGTRTIPGNSLEVGSTFRIKTAGVFQTAGGGQSINFLLKFGGVVVATSGVIGLDNVTALSGFDFEADVVIRSLGIGGSGVGNSTFHYNNVAGDYFGKMNSIANLVNTVSSNQIQLFVEFTGLASALNTLTCRSFVIQQII